MSISAVSLPRGFKAASISSGIKPDNSLDLALIVSEASSQAVAMFTKNSFPAAPIQVSKRHIKHNKAKAIIINSGNANSFTGRKGIKDAESMCKWTARALGIRTEEVLVASTGIIGMPLPIKNIKQAIPRLVKSLSRNMDLKVAKAIMTTDKKPKLKNISLRIGGKKVYLGAVAKGAGMVYPCLDFSNSTMLAIITTDACVSKDALKKALREAVDESFNSITVDACQSTNDTVFILANGLARNSLIKRGSNDFKIFSSALKSICRDLAEMIVRDAEGATKLIKIDILHAKDKNEAKKIGFAIANSSLVKTSLWAGKKNLGRIIAAIGSTGIRFNKKIKLSLSLLEKSTVSIIVNLNRGMVNKRIYTCDLTPDYIRINAGYN